MRRLIINMVMAMVASLFMVASAQTTSVEVSLPRNPVEGERFSLTITVNNADANIVTPSAPDLDGCTFLGGPGVSTGMSTSIINGHRQSTSSTSYSFTYRADKAGAVKVPAIEVKVGGKAMLTNAGQFTVLKASERQQSGQGGGIYPGQGSGASRPSGSAADFRVGPSDLFMRVELSQGTVYENQAVECVIKLYSINAQIRSISAATVPTFDGCLIESLPTPANIEWNREHYNGENYYTAVISRSLLYPQRSGEISLGGGEYTVNVYREMIVQDFPFPRRVMDDKDVTLKPHAATLKVTPLPLPQPEGFNGAVGQFSAETRLVGNTFKTNEAATLIYTIKGTGNIKYLKEPTLDLPSEFELYDPHVENDAHVSGRNMTGTMTVEYTFVPQSVGEFRIGGSEFVYFDPSRRDYVGISLPSYEINVAQGANVSNSAVSFGGKRDIEAKNTDIHYIKLGATGSGQHVSYMAHSTWFWLVFPVGIVLVAVALMLYRRSRSALSDVNARRLNKAGKVARRRLAAASKALRQRQYDVFYAELLSALQGYLGDKLQIAGSQLNRENVTSRLIDDGADRELTSRLTSVLDECEMARYTPHLSPEQADKVYDEATDIINRIENLKRKR